MPTFSLTIHADYRCRHSGMCCTADWDVPVELPVYRSLQEALGTSRLRPASPSPVSPFITGPDLPEDAAAILERTRDGACVFFERGTRLCVVHRDLGEAALPSTCRFFPRIAVRDWRGTFITLSHYCPTAASLLFRSDVPLAVVEGPAAFPPAAYEGLMVDEQAWPPLLHPRMLMDLEGYTAWERHMVARCGTNESPESTVATLRRDAKLLREWRPGGATLADTVAALPPDRTHQEPPGRVAESIPLFRGVVAAVPDELQAVVDTNFDGLDDAFARLVRPVWREFHRPLNQFLAAKSFASWTAYQGRGLASIVRSLEAALALVRIEASRTCREAGRRLDEDLLTAAFRQTDFLLNHLAAGDALAKGWSRAERE